MSFETQFPCSEEKQFPCSECITCRGVYSFADFYLGGVKTSKSCIRCRKIKCKHKICKVVCHSCAYEVTACSCCHMESVIINSEGLSMCDPCHYLKFILDSKTRIVPALPKEYRVENLGHF